jgi:thiamine pyridinylase
MAHRCAALALLTLVLGCDRGRTILHVALYPYIPDAASDGYRGLLARIESEFETQHPDVDVRLASLDPNSGAFYAFDSLRTMLTAAPGAGGFHLVEVDAALLGELVDSQLVRPWGAAPASADWHPAATKAVSMHGRVYGIPHWLCSYFVFARDAAIVEAPTAERLVVALRNATPGTPGLAARFAGDWDLTALYLDAWVDTYGARSMDAALPPADPTVIRSLRAVARECRAGGSNPCLQGGLYGGSAETAALAFADAQVDAFLGFSEHLHVVLRHTGPDRAIRLSLAPLGKGKRPIVFVDALVMRRECDPGCEAAAGAFAAYLNRPETQEWIVMAQDAGAGTVPRYLMPATLSAYERPLLRADPYYPEIYSATREAIPYPNRGMVWRWEAARRLLDSALAH